MIYWLWSSLLLFSLFYPSLGEIKCNPDCTCYSNTNDFEIQCPIDDTDLVIHLTEAKTKISIDCTYELKKLHAYQLPNITTKDVKSFRMRFCPWPHEPFQTVMERFSPQNVDSLEFVTSYSNNIVLTADHFQNLENLQRLNLNENGITDLDEDVFKNTPNLLELELQDNNVTLKKNLFTNVPLLEFLDLSGNNLENLPPGVFEPLKMLQKLHLWKNKLKNLDWSTFRGLVNLRSLELSINKIENIAEDTFKDLENLTRVNLSANKIKKISSNVFRYNRRLKLLKMKNNFRLELPDYFLANSTITHVDLTNCNLRSIPEHVFENATYLKIVRLEKNNLKYVPEVVFKGLVNLMQIRLQNNQIETLSNVFEGLNRLRLLFLQNNFISTLATEIFSDLTALEKLNLKANTIEHVDSKLFNNTRNLKIVNLSHNQIVTPIDKIVTLDETLHLIDLDLSHNNISSIQLRYLKPLVNITIRLDYNQINVVDFQNFDFNTTSAIARISLNNNPIQCCYNYDLVEFMKSQTKRRSNIVILAENLRCFSPPELKNKFVIKVPSNLTCSFENVSKDYYCPEDCSCRWEPSSKSVVIDCSYRKLKQFPKINLSQNEFLPFGKIEINLEGNYLSKVPELSSYYNVTKLFLSHNKISEVLWVPPKLEVLELDNNHISTLDPLIVSRFNTTPLVRLTLHDNPWICDCNSEILANFLRQSSKTVVENDIICRNKNQSLLDLKKPDLCENWMNTYFLIMVLLVLLAFTACAACYYRYQQQIKIWLFSRNLCLWWVTEEDLDKDKKYDAFISYSHKDEEFVVVNLLPALEASPLAYKLCLHYRNWIPGELITNQITDSVLQSKRTIVVLSKSFLESIWGKMEFRMAHTQAVTEGRTRVIIVLYEDIDINSLDKELKLYLKTNTYVKWGDPFFWNKLKYAMPHKKVFASSIGHRVANMTRVNEEDILIQSAPPSPGTTPPISLNPSLAEMNPFKFIHKLDESKFSVPL